MKPLFMWAGGKSKLISHYEPFLPENFDSYHEPFFGGGAMFIWAYNKNPNAKFYINDVNPHIVEIYKAIRDDVELFCDIMDKFEKAYLSLDPPTEKKKINNKTVWAPHPTGAKDAELEKKYKQGNKHDWDEIFNIKPTRRSFFFKVRKDYQENYSEWGSTKEAAILYFLMKTAFNGVWQVSKGKDSHGRFNTPCGLMRQTTSIYDKSNVMQWHKALQGATITSLDFKDTFNNVDKNSYTFLDPPYRSASSEEKTYADYGTNLEDDFQDVQQGYNEFKLAWSEYSYDKWTAKKVSKTSLNTETLISDKQCYFTSAINDKSFVVSCYKCKEGKFTYIGYFTLDESDFNLTATQQEHENACVFDMPGNEDIQFMHILKTEGPFSLYVEAELNGDVSAQADVEVLQEKELHPFQILIPHQCNNFLAQVPFFYEDIERTFLITRNGKIKLLEDVAVPDPGDDNEDPAPPSPPSARSRGSPA